MRITVSSKKELESYKMNLSKRPSILVANKMDSPQAAANLKAFKEKVKEPILEISAYEQSILEPLLY